MSGRMTATAERETEEDGKQDEGMGRILAFSDGVFAIAATLLVLDIRIPHVKHGLFTALRAEWPEFLSYALSFLIIGILWANHHHMFSYIRRSNHTFMMINVLFLMWVAFLPVPAALLAQYQSGAFADRRTAMAFYAGTFVIGTLLFNLVWRYGTYHLRLTAAHLDAETIRKTSQSYLIGPVVFLVDFGLAFISPEASLAMFFLLSLMYALSPFPGSRSVEREKRAR